MNWKDKFPIDCYFEADNGILYNGGTLDNMQRFPDGIFNATITDIPYGITNCNWDTIILFEKMWRMVKMNRKK